MIEALIYQALHTIPYVMDHMAKYNQKPAVFYQQTPHDMDQLWDTRLMFPRVIYNVDWRYNAERKTDGTLLIDVFCLNEGAVSPEDIAPAITRQMEDLFLTDESGTYCLLWNRTDSFDMNGKEPIVLGASISFDVVAFPKQLETIPSPIWGINQFIKEMQPKCKIIGVDALPTQYRATDKIPLIYVRQTGTKNIKTSYAMAWQSMDMNVHIIAPTVEGRSAWVQAILLDLSLEREALMQNGTPYLIMTITQRNETNPITTGQISLTGQYGILRKYKDEPKLKQMHFEKE